MEYRVITVSKSRELKDFLNLPYSIYAGNKFWVPPITSEIARVLNSKKNPYFKNASLRLFNCYKMNKIVSRVSIVINQEYEKKFGVKSAHFGFFESKKDSNAVKFLFNEIEHYCQQYGIEKIEGPFNPNHYSELGLLLNCYEETPVFFEPYNPIYYKELLENAGFSISKILHTRINPNVGQYLKNRYPNGISVKLKNAVIRSFNIKDKEADLENLRQIYNDAFFNNWHFLHVSRDEYVFSSQHLNLVTPPDLIKFLEIDNETVGAIHFALDINPLLKNFNGRFHLLKYLRFLRMKKKLTNLIFFAVGIKGNQKHTRAYAMLLNESIKIAKKYNVLSTTWMDAENKLSINASERLGVKPKKEFAIFELKL